MAIKVPNLNNSKLKYGNFPLFNAVGGLSAYKIGSYRPQLNIDFSNDTFTSANKNLGPELVTNGTFDSDLNGWTINDATRGTAVVSGERVVLTNDYALGSTSGFTGIITPLTTVVGRVYQYQANLGGTAGFSVSNNSNGAGAFLATVGTGDKSVYFVATATTTYAVLYVSSGNDAVSANFDNISVREVVSYSPASTTAASLLTHTRAGTATYTDSTGTLQTAATNELRKDNHIWDGSSWVKRCLVEPQSTNLVLNSNSLETQTVAVTPNEPHTLSFYPGASTVDLDESVASTAVDVFVYDTSKDSDGGAWRTGALAQASSWYNETLNTSTRGSRREFPAVAVIVAEADKLTIYDGDDPSLPMWMVFNVSSANALWRNPDAIVMGNGKLVVGSISGVYGVSRIDFLSETCVAYATVNYILNGGLPIAQRNAGGTYAIASDGQAIVNPTVYDVAMTVLPDAPIDPATGLPVPTIAVATEGGVSVIKDDGTVVDIVATTANFAKVGSVQLDGDTLYASFEHGANQNAFVIARQIPNADISANYAFNLPGLLASYLSGTTEDLDLDSSLRPRKPIVKGGNFLASGTTSGGTLSPLCLISEDLTAPTKGMISYVSSTYNTGWMNGDIKGAFLSDTDDTDLVDPGEIANGTFDASLSGWTYDPAAWSWDASGRAYHNFDEGLAPGKWLVTTFPGGEPAIGDQFYYSFDYEVVVGQLMVGDDYSPTSGQRNIDGTGRASGIIRITDGRQNNFAISPENTNSLVQAYIDNVVVRKITDADRSVNNNGLIVNGTVTRTAVESGADLVAYSGFSASNYLEQPYNSDLDFGTGDFCVMGWVNNTASSFRSIFNRGLVGSQGGLLIQQDSGLIKVFLSANTSYSLKLTSTTAVNSGSWRFVVVKRKDGLLSISIDGQQNASIADATDLTYANTVSRIGLRTDNFGEWLGSLALLRISATAPSAEQIAKIYEDEKVLFQDNAQATLYGSSDAVTALAYDEDTDLLHVGTSAGRSVFNGLRRINNTTTGVTTAISATNGVIAEQ